MTVRVGVLLTFPEREAQKDELLECKASTLEAHPWMKHITQEFLQEIRAKRQKTMGKYGVPTDAAMGLYARHLGAKQGVEVDFIRPHEITPTRLRSNDINFLLIYDMLESFHNDKTKKKAHYHKVMKCLLNAPNVYPPRKYQEFCCSKISYYNHLKKCGVAILPTLTMTVQEYRRLGHESAVEKVWKHVKAEGWGEFIIKPEGGQESKGIGFFDAASNVKGRLSTFLKDCMKNYAGVIVQKDVDGFGQTLKTPELRMLYSGDDYAYSVCSIFRGAQHCVFTPREEGGNLPVIPLARLKRLARRTIGKLPPVVMANGARLPHLITRVDLGVKIDGKVSPFVNEIEYVPSLYAQDVKRENVQRYVRSIGKGIVRIARLYAKSRKTRKLKGSSVSKRRRVK